MAAKQAGVPFSARLREIVKATVTESGSPDPHVIASLVIGKLTSRQHREALEVCLADWVRTVMRVSPADVPAPVPVKASGVGQHKSVRIRSWYQKVLRDSIRGEGGEWKHFGDCTVLDLSAAIAERHQKASETRAQAERFERIATHMDENGFGKVADIPEDVLRGLMDEF